MDAESKERARDYLAADIFLATVRLGGNAAIDRLPKETLRRARRLLARDGGPHREDGRRSADRLMNSNGGDHLQRRRCWNPLIRDNAFVADRRGARRRRRLGDLHRIRHSDPAVVDHPHQFLVAEATDFLSPLDAALAYANCVIITGISAGRAGRPRRATWSRPARSSTWNH